MKNHTIANAHVLRYLIYTYESIHLFKPIQLSTSMLNVDSFETKLTYCIPWFEKKEDFFF